MAIFYLERGIKMLFNSIAQAVTSRISSSRSATRLPESNSASRPFDVSVTFTAKLCAASRALEHERGERRRLIKDELAAALAGPVAMRCVRERFRSTCIKRSPRIAIRCKYFDEFITKTLRDMCAEGKGSVQLVSLGAGMDTRAFRLAGIERANSVFEVDDMSVLTSKRDALNKLSSRPPLRARKLRAVGANLISDDWPSGLRITGFDQSLRTLWIVEGVLYYLEDFHVLGLFKKVAELSAVGSQILFSSITRPPRRNVAGSTASLFKSCIPDPESLLKPLDFTVEQVDVFGGPNAHFGRCVESDIHDADDWKYEQTTIYVAATKV